MNYGMKVEVRFSAESLQYIGGVSSAVLRNITEIHYNCSSEEPVWIAFESNIHVTGIIYRSSDIREFETMLEIEEAAMMCGYCGRDQSITPGCDPRSYSFADNKILCGIPHPLKASDPCPGCQALPGQPHHFGCFREVCPRCGKRLISHECR